MKRISNVITKELFVNAFMICKEYVNTKYIYDINLLVLKDYFNSITEANVEKYYDEYIETELFYSVPFLFATETVTIPKNINGLREYRFFTIMSMVLYNAVGLLFVDICSEFVKDVKFKKENVYRFSPTSFTRNQDGKWKAKNEYSRYYKEFTDKMTEIVDDNSIVLKIDISNYFESISHSKLINLINTFGLESRLGSYDFDEKSKKALEFYFESIMKMKNGIPQGKSNCVSDLYGEIYLMPFDLNIKRICNNHKLKYKAMLRYVDDMIIVLENTSDLADREIMKDVSLLEQEISNFLYNELGLQLNPKKTEVKILHSNEMKKNFIKANVKKVSNIKLPEEPERKLFKKGIQQQFEDFVNTIEKYKFNGTSKLNITFDDKEKLKSVFEDNFKSFLKKTENTRKIETILRDLDFELTVGEINIIIALFYIKNSNEEKIYNKYLVDYIKNNLNLLDKRIIHIILLMITQEEMNDELKEAILMCAEVLERDNYGRYILLLLNANQYNNALDMLDEKCVYNELIYENRKKEAKYTRNFFGNNKTSYGRFLSELEKSSFVNESIIDQLKLFIYNYRMENWDPTFNHFQNIFHELCKNKYNLSDAATVNEIINKLYSDDVITTNEEIIIRKFYDRRNFNPVSHPSKNGKSSIMISKGALDYYKEDVLNIMINIIKNG